MDAIIDHSTKITNSISENKQSFENEDWTIERRLIRPDGVPLTNETACYMDVLPTYAGKNLLELIDERIANGEKTRILDIGCGAGLADIDLKEKYGDNVEIVAIGHEEDIKKDLNKPQRGVTFREPTEADINRLNIDFRFLNFTTLKPDEIGNFDIVIASHSLKWIAEKSADQRPDFFKEGVQDEAKKEMILKIREMLSPNGVALIAPYDQNIDYSIEGLELNHDGVSFSRSE